MAQPVDDHGTVDQCNAVFAVDKADDSQHRKHHQNQMRDHIAHSPAVVGGLFLVGHLELRLTDVQCLQQHRNDQRGCKSGIDDPAPLTFHDANTHTL